MWDYWLGIKVPRMSSKYTATGVWSQEDYDKYKDYDFKKDFPTIR